MGPSDAGLPIKIDLLHSPGMLLPDGKTHGLERRDAALLALLALDGPTARGAVAELLWPDLESVPARSNLRQRLFRLRRAMGRDIVLPEATLRLASDVNIDCKDAYRALQDNAQACPGELLGGHDYSDIEGLHEWVESARERWRRLRLDLLTQIASEREAGQQLAAALSYAERLISLDPLREHSYRKAMQVHYRRGDRAAALATFARCREALRAELATEPSAETLQLATSIEAGRDSPADAPPLRPVTMFRPPRLIGRDHEWQTLRAATQAGRVVVVQGEPGIGKSRLLSDFARSHYQVETCRALPGDARAPFSLAARLLRGMLVRFDLPPERWVTEELSRLLPELGSPPSWPFESLRLHHAYAAAMAHWQARGMSAVFIDDLQWADDASLELLLRWCAQRSHSHVLMAVRANEVPPLLQSWSSQQDRGELCTLPLGPLAESEIRLLLESLGIEGLDAKAWATSLARHTGGNPLFILETVQSSFATRRNWSHPGTLSLPLQVGMLLERRLEELPASALRLARAAAISGPDFSAELISKVLAVGALDLVEDWSTLEQAQVLRDGAFAHDLMLEATLRSVPSAIARSLHASIARALESDHRAAPARIAHHFLLGEEWAAAAAQFERAAELAGATARHEEALRFWDQAGTCHERTGQRATAFNANVRAAEAAIVVCGPDEVARRSAALSVRATTNDERLAALLLQARHHATISDFDRGGACAREALALARQLGNGRDELLASSIAGLALTMTGQPAAGVALFEAATTIAETVSDPAVTGEFFSAYGHALHAAGRMTEACVWTERAIAAKEEAGELADAAVNLGNLAAILAVLGADERGLHAAERAAALHVARGTPHGTPYAVAQLNLGISYLAVGRYGESLAAFEFALALVRGETALPVTATIEHHIANVFLRFGQPSKARQALRVRAEDLPRDRRLRRAIIEARIDDFAGRGGLRRLLAVQEELGSGLAPIERLWLQLALTEALPADEAVVLGRRTHAEAIATPHPALALTALIRTADASRRCGAAAAAAALARDAVREASQHGWHDLHAPDFWWMASQALQAGGAEVEARDALRKGSAWVSESLPRIPEPYRHSFLNRGCVVPVLMAAARREGVELGPPVTLEERKQP